MNLRLLRRFLAACLVFATGYSWATVSLPAHSNDTWQDVSSVTWSTDGGTTWGNSALVVGQTVEFKLTMHKDVDGNHYADFAKAWLDLNGDEQFSQSETLIFGYHVENATYTSSSAPDQVVNEYYDFFSSSLTVTSDMIGDHWLLARVTCSESLLSSAGVSNPWNNQWSSTYTKNNNAWYQQNFSSTLAYYQGEAQLTKLTVKDGNKVPEPGTLMLLAAAMLGVGMAKKRPAA